MFSQTTEYALRAIVWLAAHSAEPQTTLQIAAATQYRPAIYRKCCKPWDELIWSILSADCTAVSP